jgi:hypothetical protein
MLYSYIVVASHLFRWWLWQLLPVCGSHSPQQLVVVSTVAGVGVASCYLSMEVSSTTVIVVNSCYPPVASCCVDAVAASSYLSVVVSTVAGVGLTSCSSCSAASGQQILGDLTPAVSAVPHK